uniref:nesprin-1 n=1 Tax=Pristiophorus japonicus TaxID=55135 RepID=UPI00398E76DD
MASSKGVSGKRVTSLKLVTGFFQYLRDEQEAVQKRTFTKWINSHLAKRNPPIIVNDLFEDIKDGVMLLALLEVLSGQKLPGEQGRKLKRIHWVNNIGTALKFLEGRRIKLVNINSTDIADGRPSIVLGLMWTIILYFQIEELTSNLTLLSSLSSSTSSVDSMANSETGSPPSKRKVVTKFKGSAKKALLKWVHYTAGKRAGLDVKDFGQSWRSGFVFHSVIHAIRPDLTDLEKIRSRSNRENLESAFTIAETQLGIPRLLDPEDVDVDKPDEKSIMTYVAQFLKHYPDPRETENEPLEEEREDRQMLREVRTWLEQFERELTRIQVADVGLQERYQMFKRFRGQYEAKRKHVEALIQPAQKDGKLSLDQVTVKQTWERVSARLLDWHIMLDKSLPGPLGTIGAWLHRVEAILAEEIVIQQAHDETANIIHRKLEQHKDVIKALESHRQIFHQIHRAGSVNGIPIPADQLEDAAERFNFITTASKLHLTRLDFLELKYRLLAFLVLAETKLKSWIIKYGRRESVQLLLQSYISFVEGNDFFGHYEVTFQSLKQAADTYLKVEDSAEERENINKFLTDSMVQWRNLSVEVRSVRSMLEEVVTNWDKYSNTVTGLQAWLEDAEKMLSQPELAKKDFFRHLPHWIQQHSVMNDAGNFLIETCDELVSRDLKQQLLLLNGRWRELFVKVKHYARADEVDKLKKEYLDGVSALKSFVETANEKQISPLEVSFLNVKTYVQDMEVIKQKVPIMEAQYKLVSKTAQQLTKDTPQDEVTQMLATMSTVKDQLIKVRERCQCLLLEAQQLLPPLDELEKQITAFYESLNQANQITSAGEAEGQSVDSFKIKHQELKTWQEQCKQAVAAAERNMQTVQKLLASSKVLRHLDSSVLQKKLLQLQAASQDLVKQGAEWRKHMETNSSLLKRFEDCRKDLEMVLQSAQTALIEEGNPEQLLARHTDFFGQLDQRILNAFLKACDELTDILPEQEQQGLQETVRSLHKQWKDLQAEAPYHLLRLQIEAARNKLVETAEECKLELTRENKLLTSTNSEELITQHKAFFAENGKYEWCRKRGKVIGDLCQKLPETRKYDAIRNKHEMDKKTLRDLKVLIDATYQKLLDQPDKWKEYMTRYSRLSKWLLTKDKRLTEIRHAATNPKKYGDLKAALEGIKEEVSKEEPSLSWLRSRLAALTAISSENEAKRQDDELSKLSAEFKRLLTQIAESDKVLSAVGECVQHRDGVKAALDHLVDSQKQLRAEGERLLDSESLEEAQQLHLHHQQQVKQLMLKRIDVQQQLARGRELQAAADLAKSTQEELQSQETALNAMEKTMDEQEKELEETLTEWQRFEAEKGEVTEFLSRTGMTVDRNRSFSSLESLGSELEQMKAFYRDSEVKAAQAEGLLQKSEDIKVGPKSKRSLQQQTRLMREKAENVREDLRNDVKHLDEIKSLWESFLAKFESLGHWMTEKQNELNDVEDLSIPLDEKLSKVKHILDAVLGKSEEIKSLEEESQKVAQFITSGEIARVKVRLTQIGRQWDELHQHTQEVDSKVGNRVSLQQKYEEGLKKVQQTLIDMETTLKGMTSKCSSAAEANQLLQAHLEFSQSIEQIKTPLASLSTHARRVSNKDEAVQELSALQQKYEEVQDQAKEEQALLENLLSLWQKYEKDLSSFGSWLERHEAITSSWSPYLSSNQAKLQTEVQTLKDLQTEVMSQESAHRGLVMQSKALYPTTSEEGSKAIKANLQQLDKRWQSLSHTVKKRMRFFEEAVEKHQQFDECLLRFSFWVERFLSGLQSTSEISSTDLQPALNHIKDQAGAVEQQRAEQESLKDQADQLCSMCEPQDQLLHGRTEECFQLFQQADQVVERRKEVLQQLASFLETHRVAGNVLHRIRKTVETASNWDKVKTELLDKELGDVTPDIKQLESQAPALDALISKAQCHLKNVGSDSWTSCRALAEGLEVELESAQNVLGTKQSEAEALNSLWKSFKERKEQLLKTIEDIEEKADSEGLKEPTLPGLQLRLRQFNQFEEDLSSQQHELQWLMDKAKQLAQKDKSLAAEAEKEINLLDATWNDTKKLINDIQDQGCFLVALMRDYQSSKSALLKVIENSEAVAVIKSSLLDQGDIRRTLSKHEVLKSELNGSQEQLDGFTSKGKQLLAELKKIPGCDPLPLKQDLDNILDQWLDVSERLDDNIERLSVSLALWEDVLNISDEMDTWSKGSISELNEMISNLNDSQRTEVRLLELQSEVKSKGEKLKRLHSKVCELTELSRCQEPPPVLQAIEADSQKKLEHSQEVCEVARETLRDFSAQKSQMESYMEKLSDWLRTVEQSIAACANGRDTEDLRKVKELDLELVNQQSKIDSARENLNSLCRKYHSTELEGLGIRVTELIKQYETVNQLSSKTQGRLQEALQQHFNGFLQEFQQWLSDARVSVKECGDQCGDTHTIEEKQQKLEAFLSRVSVGQNKLDAAVAEGDKLVPHLPKPSAAQVQQQLANNQQEWQGFLNQCQQNKKTLEDYAEELNSFESDHKKLSLWIHQAEERLATEAIGENKENIPEMQVEVERMADFYKEIQGQRDSFDNLCQKAQALNELGYGDGGATRPASQLLSRHQLLAKTVKEKLRAGQLGLQEHQAFEDTLQSTWSWLRGVQSTLATTGSTVGSKATLEKQLLQVQEILLMKGEGEVKLNMTIGKGEQSLKSSNPEGRKAIHSQLQALKEAWAEVVSNSVNCHSQLEWAVVQWNSYLESKRQLQQWMESMEQELSQGLEQQPDLKDKLSQLERYQSLLTDIEKHSVILNRLMDKARELLERTGDASFTEDAHLEMRTQFADIVVVAKGKVKKLEDMVQDHQQYHNAVQELTNWLNSAKEELHRWADLSGDSVALQRKLKKVMELIASRRNGRERLNRVEALAGDVRLHTAANGCGAIGRELEALRADWQQWEESTLQAQSGLETMLSQTTSSEQEFEAQVAQLDKDLQDFGASLGACSQSLSELQGKTTDREVVECWQKAKETEEALKEAESTSESLKAQLNELCRFSKDLSSHSDKVSSLIKEYNSLCLQTAKYCQNKEKALEQRFRTTFREFQQWMINMKITTCFDTPQNIDEATAIIQKLQDFLSESEACQSKLNTLISKGELLSRILSKEKAEAIKAKVSTAKEDWKNLLANLHQKEAALQNLQSQMKDFEAGVGPVQEWLVATETVVQGSSAQLPDLLAKKNEQFRLQSVLEDIACRESQLNKLKEKAQHLWEEQASNKSFMHRVSQLSAWYLALNNLAKEKALRVQRTVTEHQQFSQGLKELQDWLSDARHMLESYCTPTADKNMLDSRMAKVEALLALRQEKEIQLKMVLTHGESVLRSTSSEGTAAIRKQMEDLKDSWDSLLSFSIQCKSQLEGALSQWTSYQDDVRQFMSWMDRMEGDLKASERQFTELRDKATGLGKAKLLYEDTLSHSRLLETIQAKGESMTQHYVTRLELQELEERFSNLSDKAKEGTRKAEELLQLHREYQHGVKSFEEWLEQEKEKLCCCSHLGNDVETLENTLRDLEDLERHCTEGQSLMSAVLRNQEKVTLSGSPYVEDRILESAQRDWHLYQRRLVEAKERVNATLNMLRRLEKMFQQVDTWLSDLESKVNLRTGRKSDRDTKETQLQQLQKWNEEILGRKDEVERVGLLAHQVLEESHINSSVGSQATKLAARYQGILLHVVDQTKLLREELRALEEADSALSAYTDWLRAAQKNFKNMAVALNVVDKIAMENKIKKFETLHNDIDMGNNLLKMILEKSKKAIECLEGPGAQCLRESMNGHIGQLNELTSSIRRERGNLEKCLYLTKEFLDKYQSQTKWLAEYQAILQIPVEPKVELYEKKAQLAKYKAIQQTIVSHEPGIKLVIEKGEAVFELIHDPAVGDNLKRLLSDYQELCSTVMVCVQNLEEKVREHEDYNSNLQEVEKWLLQISTRLVAPDTTQSTNLEMATQHLARHKPIMEEIAGFEHALANLRSKGDSLIANCTEELQRKFKHQVQGHLQGIRDSYSAICSTAQRLYQSLERELQKHVSHQDTVQQCQDWLGTVQHQLEPQARPPTSPKKSLKQVKYYRALQEQASTYLELLCSMCDLSDDTVKKVAADIQRTKQTIEQHLVRSQELALGWEEIKRHKVELSACFLDTEQQLQSLKRRPAEMELKIIQKQLGQVQELGRQFQTKQANITALTEKVSSLTEGHESPEHSEIGQLSNQWLELCLQINTLLSMTEEDQQRARDYHDRMSIVEVILDKFTKEWDNLARTDAESTAEHLEALKKLASVVQAQRFVLDDLKEQRQKLMDRLNPEDKELIKEQTSHFEKQWAHVENLIEKKIQISVTTLEELGQCQSKLEDLLDWADGQAHLFAEALRCSPPAELAQTLLLDHMAVCHELERQQLAHGAATEEAEKILARLGLDERQRLQRALAALHGKMGSLSQAVSQRRKYLSKALSDRTQFLMAVGPAIHWVQQNERMVASQEHVALAPSDMGKQIRACGKVSASLKEYQADVTALWAQGRELAREATEEETAEIMSQLQDLQSRYDTALQSSAQRLQELEKILVSRQYFKADLDKVCHWLKQADIVTFPQISLMSSDTELCSQLSKYQLVLEQSPESENLLLLVQRAGRELLPGLSEADHSFLDEKLNVLPKQFNCIVALAKEKSDKIQEAIAGRKEYVSLIDLTSKALSELEDQLVQMGKTHLSLSSKEVVSAQSEYRTLLGEVVSLGKAVEELNQRKETFRSSGQPWQPDEMASLASLYSRLKRQVELRVGLLDDTITAYQDHEATSLQLETQLQALGEELVKINEETLSIEEKLKNYHALAGCVQDAGSLLKRLIEQVEQFSPELDSRVHEARSQQIQAWKGDLQAAQGTIGARIMECESRLIQRIDFQTEIQHTLDWLRQIKGDLGAAANLDIKLQSVQEEIRKSQILEEEVQSSLRIMTALSSKEKEKYTESRELMPPQVESNLLELSQLEAEVQETLSTKKMSLNKVQALIQQYQRAVQSAADWLEDASALLQQAGDGLDVEGSEETLRRHVEFFATQPVLTSQLGELEGLVPDLLPSISTAGREQVEQSLASLRQRRADTEQQAQGQQDILQRCVTQWHDYQEARQQVIALMNQAEKKLSEFSTAKAATSHESEEKLTQHKSLLSVVNSLHEKITALEEQASQLESLGNDASKATISRSMATVWQRWTRLRTIAREQEKMLEEAARGWKNLTDKIETTTVVVDQLQDRLPDSSVEKARKIELLELLEYHDAFAQEVEREQSTLTVLRQQALNMLRDVAMPSTSVEDLPVMHEIKAMQDRYDNVRQKIRKSKKMVQQELKEREEVESELNAIKQWLQETREYLLNPTSDAVVELRELKELHSEVAARHQMVERLGERQRDKYLELYTILPSELSEQLAEVTLALGAIEEQVNVKEGEAQQMQAVTLDFNCRMREISVGLNDISRKLKEKGSDIVQAKIEQKRLWDKLDSCNVKLVELDATMQDFTEQNPQQSKCLTDDMTKLSSLYQQVFRQTEYRASKLNKAASQLEEFHEMLDFVLKWVEKAKNLGYSAISWYSAAQLNDQLMTYQATLRESEEIQSDLQAMSEKLDSVSDVYQTGAMSQRVSDLRRQTEELQQLTRTRLQSLQDAAKDMEQFETEVKSLQAMVKQAQVTLTSPELARLCLKEQLFQRQRLLADMEGFKQKVQAVHRYQAALRIPEEIVTNLPICQTALRLQEEASRLQHTAIQQCNILQEAVIQYEQYEQEMRHLQQLIERAHREIQEKPVSTSNIQQLQVQISRHEQDLARKIKGNQEQIAALNTKCKMLTMKAKHATMLLTVTEVEGLSEGMEELDGEPLPTHSTHPSVVMMTAGRCHTLLSPVTEESGEEGTNSELSSPTACRSPSPVANADVSVNQDSAYYTTLSAEELQTAAPDAQDMKSAVALQEAFETALGEPASSKLDDLQRSWETLKNVISQKQRTLYEALERQQKYQDSVQSVSTKMESIEGKLGEALDAGKSHDVQMAAHQALMDGIVMLQDEINELQICFAEELVSDTVDADTADQLAMQSTLTVLAERMATIKMKALGKKQLLEERLNEQVEEQRQEQALELYRSEADELDNWLLITKATLDATLNVPEDQMDMEEQLIDCQNMLMEIERKVASISELSVNSENLLMEGRPQTREQAEHLTEKLRNLKGSLVDLQKMLQDKRISIKHGVVQEKEDAETDSTFHTSPSVQEWLVQARATRYQHQQNSLQRQKELEQQLAEQKNLLRSVASSGEKIMTQQSSMEAVSEEQRSQAVETAQPESLSQELGFEGEKAFALQQLRLKWQNLQKEISAKQKMFRNTLEQNQEQQQVYGLSSGVSSGMALFKGEAQTLDKSVQTVKSLLTGLSQAFGDISAQGKDAEEQSLPLEHKLYDATSAASRWLDGVEDHLLASASLLPEKVEAHLYHEEGLAKDIEDVIEEVNEKKSAFFHILPETKKNQDVIEESLSCLQERLRAVGLTVKQQCEQIKDRLQQLMEYQTELKLLITSLADSKYIVLQKLAEALEHTVTEQLQAILQTEDDLREFEMRIGHLKERGEELQPDQAILLDLSKVQDMYEELTMIIGSRRTDLNQSLALRGQYEQALQDLADLTDTGQEKMTLDQRILVTSREDVKSLLDKHKEFFQGLESHKILTETLCKKVSTCTHQKESSSQEELMSKSSALLKEAHRRGVELEGILETWTNLAKDYEALYRQLEGVESSIPGAGLVEESEERLTERITLYQRLKGSLTEHQPQLYQVLEDGKRLLTSISCTDLEVQIAQLGEHWLTSTTRVSRELHRLSTVLKHWNRYQAEYAELNQWLQSAMERLEFWKLQSVTLPQELDAVRDHLSSFLEFSKEVDTKSSLKSSVLSRGNQLLRLKKVDTAALRSGLAQTDSQWTELLTQIPLVQEKLHQLQMEKLPSRTAINELMNWISIMDQIIDEDDERIKSAVGSQMIEQYLKKYKQAFKIDLTCKQLTVDFVNQSVLQISSHDVESKRSDKTDFAERLGIMNRRWQLLQGLVTEEIRSLEGSLESWTEYENSVQCLKTWFETQEDRLKKWHSISDLASVHTALKDCQELEDMIRVKEKEVEKVEQSGLLLIQNKKEEASSSVMDTLRELNHSWAHLDHLVGQLKITLQSVLDQWNIYKGAYEEINGHLMEARYSLSRFRLLTGSLEAVQIQVDNLQNLQEELERSEGSLQKFGSVTNQLLKECRPPVHSSLTTSLNEVNMGWNNLLQDIVEQLHASKVLLQLWQKYKDYSGQCSVTVRQLEEKSNELIKKAANRDIADEEVTKWIQDCDELLEELGTPRDSLQALSELGEELRRQVDASAAAAIQSDRLSLTQRLSSLEHALNRQRTVLQAGVQDYEAFSRRLEALEKWIVEADEALKLQDPNRSSDLTIIQDRMEELKVQMLRFSSTVPELDRLNELGYRLPLNDKEIKRMQTLNRHWSSICGQTTERFSKLQAFLLQHQTFLEKCETWMEFLVQTEQKLAVEISGNYQNLLEQQRAHELFQAEMFSRQQILHAIISDGQHLLEQGQVDDRDEFNSKLAMLSNQWQGVIRRAQQRRGIIDSQIRQWQRYREMAEKLRKWLLDVSQQLERRWSSAAPIALQQARALLDEVQVGARNPAPLSYTRLIVRRRRRFRG